ncbi:PEP-CTERM sorting domain-containing protein [Roseisolibacter agri]|uniref:Ice-binding protein C-terminal domain-containing protein n=1 Tax=Roseisolibacter agri TaxID=2014610 RepID=A0AA37VF20_9BACT|nr:PEP-CTERM sorting domain-containing protein [Roseisolibacter agri]GLC26129.1 hypothetical protein rosag_26420 [Roseisolibacter agri]
MPRWAALLVAGALGGVGLPAMAHAQILWTDWTSLTLGNVGSATGTIAAPSGPVGVSYSGQVYTTSQLGCGASYWLPVATYQSATVPNAPPPCDMIALTGGPTFGTNTVTFSQAIVNPVMAILSLGQPSTVITYNFNQPFNILSFGPGAFGGPGTLSQLQPNVLTGVEGNGVIQFQGTFSSISWTVPTPETWHGFTVGVVGVASPTPTTVPEPTTVTLLGLGLAGVGALARGRRARR